MFWLRFVTWIVPSGIIFLSLGISASARWSLPIGVISFLILTFGVGVFDGVIAYRLPTSDKKPIPEPSFIHAFRFTLTQIVLAPFIFVATTIMGSHLFN